jgi:hypothetical protein
MRFYCSGLIWAVCRPEFAFIPTPACLRGVWNELAQLLQYQWIVLTDLFPDVRGFAKNLIGGASSGGYKFDVSV